MQFKDGAVELGQIVLDLSFPIITVITVQLYCK